MSYKQIAERFCIAPATVRTHLGTIYRKLGVSTKIALLHALEEERDGPSSSEAARSADASTGGGTVSEARRQVTVLSAVPDGLASLSQTLDPEETAALIVRFCAVVGQALDHHGGLRLAGTGPEVNACFGFPMADETDAERAVNCAFEISRCLRQPSGLEEPSLSARIGIFTGPVVATAAINDADGIVGGTPYLASALARAAGGAGIVVCARTRALLGGLFTFADLGAAAIEEGADSIGRFAVCEAVGAATRFERLHGYRLSPLIGRDHEIGLLETLFDRAEAREGQVVVISGEPGIGKSRMAKALLDRLALSSDGVLAFQCSPHNRSSPLHAVIETLRRIAGVEGQGPAERLEAFRELFADALEEVPEAKAYGHVLITELAGTQGGSLPEVGDIPAESRRAALLALISRLLERRAAKVGVQLVVFEDMQWADPTTIVWLEGLIDLVETAPILILATARPEFALGRAGAHVSTIALSRLSRAQTAELVAAQSGDRRLAPALVDRIVERSEGIPLYAEELARAILELGETEDAVPTTLGASLTGRLDRLGPAREVAQAAAVIGRDFDAALLAEIVPHGPKALQKAVDSLVTSRLVLRRGKAGNEAFRFKHALIRDVAYNSLLKTHREELHRRVADALIGHRDAGRDVAPELIARHLADAGEHVRSLTFWALAAQAAFRQGGYTEATQLCDLGLSAAEKITDLRERDQARIKLHLHKDNALVPLADMSHMLENLEEAEGCARRLRDIEALFNILGSRNYVLASTGRLEEANGLCHEILSMAEKIDNAPSYVLRNIGVGRTFYASGRYVESMKMFLQLQDIVGTDLKFGFAAGGMNFTINCYVFPTVVLCELGDFDGAARNIEIAYSLVRRISGKSQEHLWVAAGAGRLHYLRGDHVKVIECQEHLLDVCLCHSPMYLQRLAMSIGPALVATGERERGLAILAQADEMGASTNFLFGRALMLAEYARGLLMCDRAEQAVRIARRAIETARTGGEKGNEGWARLAAAEAAAALGRVDEAAGLVAQAAKIARERQMVPLLSRCEALDLGQLQ